MDFCLGEGGANTWGVCAIVLVYEILTKLCVQDFNKMGGGATILWVIPPPPCASPPPPKICVCR